MLGVIFRQVNEITLNLDYMVIIFTALQGGRNIEKKCVFNNALSRFASDVIDRVLGLRHDTPDGVLVSL